MAEVSFSIQMDENLNVYCYLMEDGNIITLPVHLVRIANVMIGGEPVLEFNCKSVRDDMRQQGVKAQKDFLEDEDLKVRLEGFRGMIEHFLGYPLFWVTFPLISYSAIFDA